MGVLPMCFSTLQILARFAIIIPINMVLAILFGLHFFTPMLMLVRAGAPSGALRNIHLAPEFFSRVNSGRTMFPIEGSRQGIADGKPPGGLACDFSWAGAWFSTEPI